MTCTRFLTAAAILMACGCTESPAGPTYVIGTIPEPQTLTVTGTVLTDSSVSPLAVSLRLDSGELIDLVGSQAQRLATLDGAQVQLRGNWGITDSTPLDSDVSLDSVRPAFAVDDFVVLAVGGRPAIDGIVGQDEGLGTYYLQLTTGDVYWFEDGTADFEALVGRRIWVTGSTEDPPLVCGVID